MKQINIWYLIFKNVTTFTNCISKINNTQIDQARDTDVVLMKCVETLQK